MTRAFALLASLALLATLALCAAIAWGVGSWMDHALAFSIGGTR